MSLVSLFRRKGPSGFGYESTSTEVIQGLDLSGKTYLVTGATSGLGRETVRVLSRGGARVFATARTREKARALVQELGGAIEPLPCELANPVSVRACVDSVKRQAGALDGIICNAGIMAPPKLERACGYELQFFTNHMGHFLLTTGLLSTLGEEGRIVMVSSSAHTMVPRRGIEFDNLTGDRGYSPWQAYGQSKLANLLHAKALARRLPHSSQTANAVHPGVIATNLQRSLPKLAAWSLSAMSGLFLKSIPQGAATSIYVAVHPRSANISGEYFVDCNVQTPSALACDEELSERLFQVSSEIAERLS